MYGPSRKRSFDDNDRDGGGYKRFRSDDHYSGGSRRHDRRGGGEYERFNESDRARAWRLAKKAIIELGDGVERDQLTRTCELLLRELDPDEQEVKLGHLAALVLRGASRLAHKTAVYATLVGLVNARKPSFGREIVTGAAQCLQKDMESFNSEKSDDSVAPDTDLLRRNGDVDAVATRVRLTVRLLTELVAVKVCRAEDVLAMLDTLQGLCTPEDWDVDDETYASLRVREDVAAWKDFFASVVLDALLHSGKALITESENLYDSLLSRCREYVSHREEESNPRGSSFGPSSWLTRRLQLDLLWAPETDDDVPILCKSSDTLSLTYDALNALQYGGDNKAAAWKLPGINHPQDMFSSSFESAVSHELAVSLSIDISKLDSRKIPSYKTLFRILSDESGAAGAMIAKLPLASYLISRSHFHDALETCHPKPAIAAKVLLGLCRAYNNRFASFENEGASPVKSEYLLVETLLVAALGESTIAKQTYYCSVLYHLVKTDAQAMSPALAVEVELLFREVPTMRAAAVESFVLLLSHFLSNFEFKWRWAAWSYVLEASEDDPQRLFVSSVIERCVRLSYLQHMQNALPEDFHVLLPPAPKPRIHFKPIKEDDAVKDEASPASDFYQSVTTKLKGHPPALALRSWLNEALPRLEISRAEAVEIVWTCILEAGAATFTHLRLLLEKYGKRNELFGSDNQPADETDADELVVVKTVASVWLLSPQHIGLILNAMLRQNLLRPSTIVAWAVTSDAVQQYSWPYMWEILNDTLQLVQDAICTKTQQLEQASLPRASDDRDNDEMLDVAALEDDCKRLQDELQQLLVQLFRGLNRVITDHKSECDSEGLDPRDNWFRSALAQMQALGLRYRVPLENALDKLQLEVFSVNASADADATKIFQLVRDSYRSA
ncbi:nuclear cap-binding protein [Plasmopara halstedii]|uniref:Nuclear cap-binding protein n=1 Tax=Plasmopara halstedii TaxID=4781 RepID=A0A0P1AD86_PLAHL|nr:nuclear cap-binding protein [Plasmopara halstedii]CEG38535.1 nuclear cap-binding protein [Plasmopara halstedii]|eukprot:XP_024574904.1 nuclear cap-binding protein [Plasmopara halstedii]